MSSVSMRPRQPARPGRQSRSRWAATIIASATVAGLAATLLLAQQGSLPGLVTNLLLTPGDRRITAEWQAPRTGSPPGGYEIRWTPFSGRSSAQLDTSVRRFTIDGLVNGREYTVSVAATDGLGNHGGYRRATATPTRSVAIAGYDVYVSFWTDPTATGRAATIHASASSALGDRGAVYWFFGDDNPEVFVKVLDGCAINGYEWAYVATLTTLKYNVLIVRRSDGVSRDYRGAAARGPWTHSDAAAFPCAKRLCTTV